jgi:hypothetical protein
VLRALQALGDPGEDSRGFWKDGRARADRRVCALVAQPVKKVFHLVAPKLALVFHLDLAAGEILDD